MPTSIATLEVDVRRCSPQTLYEKLERTMGVSLILRRARITEHRCWLLLEVAAPPAPVRARRRIG